MKKTISMKILMIILTIFCMLGISSSRVLALGDIISSGGSFENARFNYTVNGIHSDMEIDEQDLKNVSNTVYNILLILGMVIAVIIGMVLGIKFMTGSIEEQAKVKESLIPYIAGCAIIFGAFTIWKIVIEVMGATGL